ncbi:hypothetical protein [Rahnella aceris]|uniref:hypothetical protein n=1 Tax=Rahnella sp. (strain Y9602) TaxID=2703885 RepID=UPI001C279616|nr:hypothetical protein [Rahnella aceris]MBU9866782.1 hypothetical protein [Rahnella aceris]
MQIDINVSISPLHEKVAVMKEGDAVIGYLTSNEGDENPFSVVSPEGDDMGNYCCKSCSVNAAWKRHHKVIDVPESEKPKSRSQINSLILLALLARLAS